MENTPTERKEREQDLTELLFELENPQRNNQATEQQEKAKPDNEQKIDVLNLPPRNEVHSKKPKRMKIKFPGPYLRIMIVTLLLIILFTGGFYIWGAEFKEMFRYI